MCETAPKLEFPCSYPIKILGENNPDLRKQIISVMTKHSSTFDDQFTKIRQSKRGRWQSITVIIQATGESQIKGIYDDLRANPLVRMVL
ncbi:MAG: DUF493 domain-containing protein [Cellvibrionales bacterium TMED148]|nr:hypothetical protein [Porticoccaceae bacterium]RPG93888.1 MAG: DUF493 domain-containing protein [Cellvibrionales bacterium TMED148]|tara:strand:+ start:135 stop:401 length:267 start_codon:yes stop_codon:yes gene_type:complete